MTSFLIYVFQVALSNWSMEQGTHGTMAVFQQMLNAHLTLFDIKGKPEWDMSDHEKSWCN